MFCILQGRGQLRQVALVSALLGFIGYGGWLISVHCLAEYHLRQGRQALDKQHLSRAWEQFQLAKKYRPRSPEIQLLLARVARQRQLYQQASTFLHCYQDLGGADTEEVQLERLMLRAQIGEITSVFDHLWRYVEDGKPQAPLVLEALVVGALGGNYLSQAMFCLARWQKLAPDSVQRLLYAGLADELRYNTLGARDNFQRALALVPERTDIRLHLAGVLLVRQEHKEAVVEFRHVLREEPTNGAARLGLAQGQRNLGHLKPARETLEALLRDEPDNVSALRDLGWVALDEGKLAEAETLLRKALKRDPGDHDALYNLVICLRRLTRPAEAEAYVQRINQIEKDSAKLNSVLLQLAQRPDDVELAYEAAKTCFRLGHETQGLQWFGRVLKVDPDHAGTLQRLAEYFDKHGDKELAAQYRARVRNSYLPRNNDSPRSRRTAGSHTGLSQEKIPMLLPSGVPATAPRHFLQRRARVSSWVLLGFVAAAGLLVWANGRWRSARPPQEPAPSQDEPIPPDPRLSYKGPFRNIQPSVRYVGSQTCAGCHKTETDGFHRHPMGRSVVPVAALGHRSNSEARNSFKALQLLFTVERQGGRMWRQQQRLDPKGKVLATFRTEVHYAIGSGHRGHSYFTTRDGFLFQTPVSWYSQKQIWDLSPGFSNGRLRPVGGECLFCHSDHARPVVHSANRYEVPILPAPTIGCERCHGPGDVHVKARRADLPVKGHIDFTIVNPKHLPTELRENICQQCHLEGAARVLRRGRHLFDYRPGLPLRDFWAIYVPVKELNPQRRAVSQVEQMHQSKCFKASKGRRGRELGCATCHDPHEAPPGPAERIDIYRNKCLECHRTEHACSLARSVRLEKSKQDSCIDCHMPRLGSSDIAHTASTDHSIPRLPSATGQTPSVQPEVPLVPFHGRPEGDVDADRDLGLALVHAAGSRGAPFPFYLSRATSLLTKAAERRQQDLDLLEGLASGLRMQGRTEEALEVYLRLLSLEPKHEMAARAVSSLALGLQHYHHALKAVETALALDPWYTEGYLMWAVLLIREERYAEALLACRKLLEQDPTEAEGWVLLAHCHRGLGQAEEAVKDEQRAEAMKSESLPHFRAWLPSVLR